MKGERLKRMGIREVGVQEGRAAKRYGGAGWCGGFLHRAAVLGVALSSVADLT